MSKSKFASSAEIYLCDDRHVHIELKDRNGDNISEIALDLEDGLETIQNFLGQLEEVTGLIFVLIDPDELTDDEDDTIGPVMGSC